MTGYRAKRRKLRSKSYLGRSFLISLIINFLFIFFFSNLTSFDLLKMPEEEIILVTMVELPTLREPVTARPEIEAEEPVAELSTMPRVEPALPEPAREQEIETQPAAESQDEIAEIVSTPRAEVKIPEIEIPSSEEMPAMQEQAPARQDVQVASGSLAPSITSRRDIEGEVLEPGQYEIQASMGQPGRERIESTYGNTVTPGQISNLPRTIEKESPFGNRPLAVTIDNADAARPQSGLDKANIVYEVLAEGGITRFLAIYAAQEADVVGPVRSARPYFITKAMEHSAIYVHAGESPDAARFIREERIDDINELVHYQPFWRSSDRRPPHNLYASTEQLREEAKNIGYLEMINRDSFQFEADSNQILTGADIQRIDIRYNVNYSVRYQYNPETKRYIRFINDIPHIDAETGMQLQAKNIIIQHSEKKVLDEEGRLAIDLLGRGDGLIIFNGKSEEITWKKETLTSKTYFYNKNGDRLAIQPGNVWIQITHPDTQVRY